METFAKRRDEEKKSFGYSIIDAISVTSLPVQRYPHASKLALENRMGWKKEIEE